MRRTLFSARVLAACLLLALGTGCGRHGREVAREKIRQSHHAFTADDFVKAAGEGDMPLVEAYLQGGIDHNAADARGLTALMAAAMAGKADAVKALLDDNARPDLQNKDGDTALILAATANQPEAVRALVDANADVRVRNHKNLTALLKAVNAGYDRVVDVLLATSGDQLKRDGQLDTALSVVALLGNTKIATQLLDHGANINSVVADKQTALMHAATYGKQDIVELLLARGADPRLVGPDGANASVLALQHGFPDVAKILDAHTPGGTSPAIAANKSASPTPAPTATAAPPSASPQDAASVAREQTWLKEQGVTPAAVLAKDTGQDDDKDGFTNDEELAAGTDPNDPKSHPPLHAKLRLRHIDGEAFPIVFEGAEGKGKDGRIVVSVRENGNDATGRRVELEPGGRVPGTPYKVERLRPKFISEKDTGRRLDVGELTLVNTDTGRKTVLVRSMPSNSADARAVMRFTMDGTDITVKQGEEFALPRDPDTRYQVVDIRPTQVVLKIVGTAQTVTVEK